jgi:hypothetical protein
VAHSVSISVSLEGRNVCSPFPAENKIPFSPKLAVDYMEQGALGLDCKSGNALPAIPMVRTWWCGLCSLRSLGQPQKELRDFFVATLQDELATDPADLRPELDSTQAVYVAAGLAIWDAHVTHRLSPETAEALEHDVQTAAGGWRLDHQRRQQSAA